MSADLLWPGLHRAGPLFDDAAVLAAMLRVEAAWLAALESAGIAPPGTAAAVAAFPVEHLDREALAVSAEAGGNPVIPLLAALRQGLAADAPQAAELVHRGLTSQDVLDTALVLCAGSCLDALAADLDALVEATAQLAERHRGTLLAARTLGQHAVPTTFGARAAGWCAGLLAARDGVRHTRAALRVQAGGAAGTMARAVEMCRAAGSPDAVADTERLVERLARELGLRVSRPWHTVRHPVTEIGDVLLAVSDALGHVANDVVLQSRPELGELAEPAGDGRGASSTMPQKRNPVLSVLLRRHAQSAPLLAAQLHLAAAGAAEERPDGAWHLEWAPLRDLCRRTVVAARQARDLVGGLHVDPPRMRAGVDAALPGLLAEAGAPALRDPAAYLGWAGRLVDVTVAAARTPTTAAPPAKE